MELREALDRVPDHRKSQGRRHPWGAVLGLAVCAMLCGARRLYGIAQWGRDQGVVTGQLLGFRPASRRNGRAAGPPGRRVVHHVRRLDARFTDLATGRHRCTPIPEQLAVIDTHQGRIAP